MTNWCDEFPPYSEEEKERFIREGLAKGLKQGGHPIFAPKDASRKKTFCIASWNRASEGPLSKLRDVLDKDGRLDYNFDLADYMIAPGDRHETFEVCLEKYNIVPIIHLWAGEVSQGTNDEIYRWAITNMSMMQLCTNESAAARVGMFCEAIGKKPNIHVVGNVMLDNMPECLDYDVVLYNPPTLLSEGEIRDELNSIANRLDSAYFWTEPNGDHGSDLVDSFVNFRGFSRHQFLSLVKHCRRFFSNSSCIDYEIKHIIPEDRIVRVGERNRARSSMNEKMDIPDATENIMDILRGLDGSEQKGG